MSMKTGNAGLNLIKSFEGCRLTAYKDAVNVLTIGYGHTGNVKEGQVISQAQAEQLLRDDLNRFENGVEKLVTVELNQNQFDALVSFSYNLGLGNLQNSDLLKYVNKKDFTNASKEFTLWVHAGGIVLNGLVRRRSAERDLFITPAKSTVVKKVAIVAKKVVAVVTGKPYTVVKGDTLSKIALDNKTTVDAIKKLNKLNSDVIKIGQRLKIK